MIIEFINSYEHQNLFKLKRIYTKFSFLKKNPNKRKSLKSLNFQDTGTDRLRVIKCNLKNLCALSLIYFNVISLKK